MNDPQVQAMPDDDGEERMRVALVQTQKNVRRYLAVSEEIVRRNKDVAATKSILQHLGMEHEALKQELCKQVDFSKGPRRKVFALESHVVIIEIHGPSGAPFIEVVPITSEM